MYIYTNTSRCTMRHTAASTLQDTHTHCNTLQHTATHCNTLHHSATLCNTRKCIYPHTCVFLEGAVYSLSLLTGGALALQHSATLYNTLGRAYIHILSHTANCLLGAGYSVTMLIGGVLEESAKGAVVRWYASTRLVRMGMYVTNGYVLTHYMSACPYESCTSI